MVSQAREFPVDWPSPEAAEKFWAWDGMHCPKPLTPLSIDFALSMVTGQARVEGRDLEKVTLPLFLNGYWYTSFAPPDPNAPPDAVAQAIEGRYAEAAPRLRRLWQRECLPQIRRIAREIADIDAGSMPAPALARNLSRSVERAGHAFGLTLYAAGPMFVVIEKLYTLCQEEFGAEGIALAGASVQGYQNESSASDAALYDLAGLVRKLDLQGIVALTPPERLIESLRPSAKGRQFIDAFQAYLDRYGWRTPTWFELSEPAWREDPTIPLALIKETLSAEANDPRTLLARSAKGRRNALRTLRARFAAPEKRAKFEDAWRAARPFVSVSESRALWQLSLGGYLRVPALALGKKLRQAGQIAGAEDIFYLRLAELESGDGSNFHETVAERRAGRERFLSVVPPLTLGRLPNMAPATPGDAGRPPELPFAVRMISGFGGERSLDERILKGHAASPGTVTGVARVVESVDEADRVRQGDILVCRFTTPSWAHLFSRVSAIVADSGGVLSHCAILAREYGIPCVPGVRVGTRRIRDGMRLTVDGTQGIVRLEE